MNKQADSDARHQAITDCLFGEFGMKMSFCKNKKEFERLMELCGAYLHNGDYFRNTSAWCGPKKVGTKYSSPPYEVPAYLYAAYINPGYALKKTEHDAKKTIIQKIKEYFK